MNLWNSSAVISPRAKRSLRISSAESRGASGRSSPRALGKMRITNHVKTREDCLNYRINRKAPNCRPVNALYPTSWACKRLFHSTPWEPGAAGYVEYRTTYVTRDERRRHVEHRCFGHRGCLPAYPRRRRHRGTLHHDLALRRSARRDHKHQIRNRQGLAKRSSPSGRA